MVLLVIPLWPLGVATVTSTVPLVTADDMAAIDAAEFSVKLFASVAPN
jgi:hypothetical protein